MGSREPQDAGRERAPNRRRAAIALAVAAAAFVAFLPALRNDWVDFDDLTLLVRNDAFRGFGREQLAWIWTNRIAGHWMPLTWTSYALDDAISGPLPWAYHLQSLAWHAAGAATLFFVALALARRARPAWTTGATADGARADRRLEAFAVLAALLFALHPLRVESVAWATERRDVLSTPLLLGALLAWLAAVERAGARASRDAREDPSRPGSARLGSSSDAPRPVSASRAPGPYALSIALLALSLLAKAWGLSFFLVALVLDVWPLRRLPPAPWRWFSRERRAVVLEKLPYLALGLVAGAIAQWAIRSQTGTVLSWERWTLGDRLVQAAHGLAFYPWKTLWPTGLVPLYELPYELDPLEPRFVLSYLGAAGLVAIGWLARRRAPALTTALLVYAILIAPVLGFSQAGPQLVADRYSYVACIGIALAAAAGWAALVERARGAKRLALCALAVLVPALLGALAWRQTLAWRDTWHLWSHALSVDRPGANAHRTIGVMLRDAGHLDEARGHLEQAVAIRPDFGDAWFALGALEERAGRIEAAERAFRESAEHTQPGYLGLLRLARIERDVRKRPDAAIALLREAVADVEAFDRRFYNPRPRLELGAALVERGRPEDLVEARAHLEHAAQYERTGAEATRLLARIRAGSSAR